ncbi:GNAT family N-acetyltransferase [Microbacterium sp. W1N]|uniref:GNAT family N-acetyltransferase n=1 Tax=Microbacterium festucae TaxID=2977531 RepID=UPI0021C1C7D7|nr:GNAT family N-acetyltransferase [Microbacterium festucae]MCT9821431.1 GNAT family N-acetyltransferase [Microbacterium festucae]
MDFLVRTPVASDAPAIAALHVRTWQETYAHLLPAGFFDEAHTRMRHDMWTHILGAPRPDRVVRLAEVDGVPTGFAFSGPSMGTADAQPPRARQLYCLYVSRGAHGTGIGQALLDETLGADPAMLWVAAQNPRAIAFYRRNGFAFDGVEQIDPGAPAITDARMVR